MTAETSDAEYALQLCAQIAACTDVPGTITRMFLSPATRTVHALLKAEMEAIGMQVRVDGAGNIRGLWGEEAGPRLAMGSHIDTVPDAGAYDGVLGVAAALALVRRMGREERKLRFALEVIAFSEEEGVRFGLPFIGSRGVTGELTPEMLARTDAAGVSLAEALCAFGLQPETLLQSHSDALLSREVFGFLEVHVEQGPVLEAEGVALGVVSAIVGQSRLELRFAGQANHAGTTPMKLRCDPLAAAAAWMAKVEEYASQSSGLVATVGMIRVEPGAANVIAGMCVCSLDVRHREDGRRAGAVTQLLELADGEGARRGVTVCARELSCQGFVAMDTSLQHGLMKAAQKAGTEALLMNSGAGHDAMILATRVPAAMLFVRSPGGISHHPSEAVCVEDVQAAVDCCARFLTELQPAAERSARR